MLLLDEPTSGVDVSTRHDILHLLADLHEDLAPFSYSCGFRRDCCRLGRDLSRCIRTLFRHASYRLDPTGHESTSQGLAQSALDDLGTNPYYIGNFCDSFRRYFIFGG